MAVKNALQNEFERARKRGQGVSPGNNPQDRVKVPTPKEVGRTIKRGADSVVRKAIETVVPKLKPKSDADIKREATFKYNKEFPQNGIKRGKR